MTKKISIVRLVATSSVVAVIGFAAFMYWAVAKQLPRYSTAPVDRWPSRNIAQPKATVTVMTYNIGHGQGVKDLPTDWRGEDVTKMQLTEVAAAISRADADFVFLQEVDLYSHRTQNINQIEFLLERTDYPYYACAIVWDKNYLPFPFWPVSRHLGHVLSANCILAKYPIKGHEAIIFDKPESNPLWYNLGYIDRGAHKVSAQIGSKQLTLVNLHLEADEEAARLKQVVVVTDWIKTFAGPVIVGGDFNSLPPEACIKGGFIDELHVDLTNDTTIADMRKLLGEYNESLPVEACPSDGVNLAESATFTFPADVPTRTLDYLFAMNGATIKSSRVVSEAGTASDHLPVIAEVQYE